MTGCATATMPSAAPSESEAIPQPTAAAKASEPTFAPEPTQVFEAAATEATQFQSTATQALPAVEDRTTPATATPARTEIPASEAAPTVIVEARLVELEWPAAVRLGESDVVRLALIPSHQGYVIQADFPEHPVLTQTVPIERPAGYALSAIARLDATGFETSPADEQEYALPVGESVVWRWSLTPRAAGQQRVTVSLTLRWQPNPGNRAGERRVALFSRSLQIQVLSFLGLTRLQALAGGFVGLFMGGGLGLAALLSRGRAPRRILQILAPNPALTIEPRPGLGLSAHERALFAALFQRYARITLEQEFLSGYSGARAFLVQPIRPDGRADAFTIVKVGDAAAIEREYRNYDTFVKDTLPPITARIQHPPVTIRGEHRAALQYTFIGAPGHSPQSLRQALLETPNPSLLTKIFETFGPNWWMQRRPYTFRLAQEYDRMLPSHWVIEPTLGPGKWLDASTPGAAASNAAASNAAASLGEIVTLRGFRPIERSPDGLSQSLSAPPAPGLPALRVRWLSRATPVNPTGKIVATRQTLLRGFVQGLDLLGLPDPLERLPLLLTETVRGTQSTIHGDLNLENILVGPGGFVWLIDFAQTREGHPLLDFAHLEAEIIAHVIAPQLAEAHRYLDMLNGSQDLPHRALLDALHQIAERCLFNPTHPREYHLSLTLACMGALKFTNLDAHARHLLYLTAAHTAQNL
jgi:hypothetical protein